MASDINGRWKYTYTKRMFFMGHYPWNIKAIYSSNLKLRVVPFFTFELFKKILISTKSMIRIKFICNGEICHIDYVPKRKRHP